MDHLANTVPAYSFEDTDPFQRDVKRLGKRVDRGIDEKAGVSNELIAGRFEVISRDDGTIRGYRPE